MKIWYKYLLKELIKTFSLFFFLTVILYLFVDISIHGARFFKGSSFVDLAYYYLYSLSTLLDLFLSLTFLLAAIKVLFDLNIHRELVALQMTGLSKKKLLSPFFVLAICLCSLSLINSEYFAPNAEEITYNFKLAHRKKGIKKERIKVHSLILDDGSKLVYQNFDTKTGELFDVFWLISSDEIWHMKTLNLDSLTSNYTSQLKRNKQNQIEKVKSFESFKLIDLKLDKKQLINATVSPESRPISTLISDALIPSTKKPIILSHLYYKLILALTPFLILFVITPFCMRYSRFQPILLITTLSICSLIGFKVI